jgi:outer membrane lipoprotein-sorting protein
LKKYFVAVLLFLEIIPFLFNGCVPSQPNDEVELLPSERLINKLEVNRRRIRNFEGYGTMAVKSSKINNSANFRVIIQKPDSIYLSIMGPFGIELAQILVTKDNFVFYDALENTAYKGIPNDEVLRDIFHIDLSFNDIIDAFIGSVNLTQNLYKMPDDYKVDYDQYVLTYIDSLVNTKTKYWVDIRQLGITKYDVWDAKGDVALEGKYSKFDLIEGVPVPYKIEVQRTQENQLINITYKNMEANQKDIYIDFVIPKDASVINL